MFSQIVSDWFRSVPDLFRSFLDHSIPLKQINWSGMRPDSSQPLSRPEPLAAALANRNLNFLFKNRNKNENETKGKKNEILLRK